MFVIEQVHYQDFKEYNREKIVDKNWENIKDRKQFRIIVYRYKVYQNKLG